MKPKITTVIKNAQQPKISNNAEQLQQFKPTTLNFHLLLNKNPATFSATQNNTQFGYQPEVPFPVNKGKTSMERIVYDMQSDESGHGQGGAYKTNKSKKRQTSSKQSRAKSAGKKKTMSISPKCKTNYEVSSLVSMGSKAPHNKEQSINSNSATSGGHPQKLLQQPTLANSLNNPQLKQFLANNNLSKKRPENLKDFNLLL